MSRRRSSTPTRGSASSPRTAPDGVDAHYLYPGWNSVGWTGNTSIDEATAPIAGSFDSVFTFAAESQTFSRYAPDAPQILNDLDTLAYGDGLLIFVTAPGGAIWTRPPASGVWEAPLQAGFNLLAWTAERRSVPEAVAGLAPVLNAVYGYDAVEQRYRVYRPDGPAFLNDLATLEPGAAIWVDIRDATVWVQG